MKTLANGQVLGARETGWQLTGVDTFDFSAMSIPIATPSLTIAIASFASIQPAILSLGSLDSFYGSAQGSGDGTKIFAAGALTVAQAGQVPWLGLFSNPVLISRSNANAVVTYGAAGNVSLNLVLVSGSTTSGTSQSQNLMTAGLSLSGLTNIQTAMALNNIPTARQEVTATNAQIPNTVRVYPGDMILAQFTNSSGGAITIANGNTLCLTFDLY